jgi:hypothetical protein
MLTFEIPKHSLDSLLPEKDFPELVAKMFIGRLYNSVTFDKDTARIEGKTYKIITNIVRKHPSKEPKIKVVPQSITCLISSNYSEAYMLGKYEGKGSWAYVHEFKPFGFWNLVDVKRRGV